MNNWKTVVGEKYFDYCTLEKIRADHSKMDGHVVYLISYNSSASFYLSNNSQYILDRINSLFGYELATKLQVKEIPTVVRVRQQETPKQNYRDAEIENTDIDKKLGDDEILKKSLLELQKYL
jgi:hypothetical protein